jgi:predicted acetyltransferase
MKSISPIIRKYNSETDRDAVHRILWESGILEKGEGEILDVFIHSQDGWVAEVDDSVECFVLSIEGEIRYLAEDLPLAVVAIVATGIAARQQGLAKKLTAHVVAQQALNGAAVSSLGIFDQGFYNNLGYGNGSYENLVSFHPSRLKVYAKPRIPRRLTIDDAEAVHQSRLDRHRGHGTCNLFSPGFSRGEMLLSTNGFGLGYFDGPNGELTHHLWFKTKNAKPGSYSVAWIVYRSHEQLQELMGLLKGMGDQVQLITVVEPPGIQLQDLLEKPFQYRAVTRGSTYEQRIEAIAFWQIRICDMEACLSGTRLAGPPVTFNLELTDPIERYLDEKGPWKGLSGDYIITFGENSKAEKGKKKDLPTLKASVNAFSRLWLGVVSATGLRVTDDLSGPDDLIGELDRILRLPRPSSDWEY